MPPPNSGEFTETVGESRIPWQYDRLRVEIDGWDCRYIYCHPLELVAVGYLLLDRVLKQNDRVVHELLGYARWQDRWKITQRGPSILWVLWGEWVG